MDLHSLRFFVATIETGSFAGAAAALGVTQPAVSRQVRLLERELGTPLVMPAGPRRLGPTSAGEALLAGARRLRDDLAHLAEDVRGRAAEPVGPLSVAVPQALGLTLMQAVLPDFIRRYPRVKLSVLSGYSGYVEDWLLRSEADLGLLYGQPRHTALRTESFLELEMFVVAPPHEAAGIARQGAHGWHCSLAELSRLPLILPGKHHGLRVLVDDALVTAGLPPARVVVEIDSLPLLRRLVSEGIGYSVLGHDGVRAEIASGTLSLIPIAAPGLRWCLSFACLSSRQTSPAAAALQSMTLAAVRDLIGAGQLLGRVLEPQR